MQQVCFLMSLQNCSEFNKLDLCGVSVVCRTRVKHDAVQCVAASQWLWGYSSVVEHSTADREVPGSNPGAPSPFYFFFSFLCFPLSCQ